MVLIKLSLVKRLRLKPTLLTTLLRVDVAIAVNKSPCALTHFVMIWPVSLNRKFQSQPLYAIVTDDLCVPLILRLPFLVMNQIACNYAKRECNIPIGNKTLNLLAAPVKLNILETDILAAIIQKAHTPDISQKLLDNETEFREAFKSIFKPLPHVNKLPMEPLVHIKLKDRDLSIGTRNYACPRKWKESWHALLQQHLESGRIRPLDTPTGSSAFIIPKADPAILPR